MIATAQRTLGVLDAFLDGEMTPDQFGMLLSLTGGMMVPLESGTVILRRRKLTPRPERWVICGYAAPSQSTIANDDSVTHAANTSYWYSTAQVFGNGIGSAWSEPVRLDFDGGSNLITPGLPNAPEHVRVTPLAGGKFLIEATYRSFGQGGPPTDCQVFAGAAPGSVDYGTPLVDSVTGLSYAAFDALRERFSFTTASFADGTGKAFAVRARSAAGVAERNELPTAVKIARAAGPTGAEARRVIDIRRPS